MILEIKQRSNDDSVSASFFHIRHYIVILYYYLFMYSANVVWSLSDLGTVLAPPAIAMKKSGASSARGSSLLVIVGWGGGLVAGNF